MRVLLKQSKVLDTDIRAKQENHCAQVLHDAEYAYHGGWQLHNHGHVNGDIIALLDTYAFEIVGNSADHLQ